MKYWQIGFLLLITLIIFGQYIYYTPGTIAGADTWFYINQICEKSPSDNRDYVFDTFLMPFFPCDFTLLKIYLAILFFITIFFAAKIGELYEKSDGWIMGPIVGVLTFFSLEYIVFENDTLAYTLFFIALYLIIRREKNNLPLLSLETIGATFLLLVAGLVWKASIYWLWAAAVFILPIGAIAFVITIWKWDGFLWFLNAYKAIQEHASWIGVIYYGITIFFIYGMLKSSKKEVLACCLMIIPGIFVLKLYVLAIPFLGIIAINGIFALKKYKDTIIMSLLVLSLFMAIFWGMQSGKQFPTENDLYVVMDISTKIDTNELLQNTFGVGYVAMYYDLNVSSYGSTDGNDYICSGYVIEHPEIATCTHCTELKKSDNLISYYCK